MDDSPRDPAATDVLLLTPELEAMRQVTGRRS